MKNIFIKLFLLGFLCSQMSLASSLGYPANGNGNCLWLYVSNSGAWVKLQCYKDKADCLEKSLLYESKKECRVGRYISPSEEQYLANNARPFYYYIVDYLSKGARTFPAGGISYPNKLISDCKTVKLHQSDVLSYFSSLEKEAVQPCKKNNNEVYCYKAGGINRYFKYFNSENDCHRDLDSMKEYMVNMAASEERLKPKGAPDENE